MKITIGGRRVLCVRGIFSSCSEEWPLVAIERIESKLYYVVVLLIRWGRLRYLGRSCVCAVAGPGASRHRPLHAGLKGFPDFLEIEMMFFNWEVKMADTSSILTFLQTYQSGLVGLIGFGGVILTLRTNAKIARDGREETRKHERHVLATALLAETELQIDALQQAVIRMSPENLKTQSVAIPGINLSIVTEANFSKLGLLSNDAAQAVLASYLGREQTKLNLKLVRCEEVGDGTWMVANNADVELVRGCYQQMLEEARKANRLLKRDTLD